MSSVTTSASTEIAGSTERGHFLLTYSLGCWKRINFIILSSMNLQKEYEIYDQQCGILITMSVQRRRGKGAYMIYREDIAIIWPDQIGNSTPQLSCDKVTYKVSMISGCLASENSVRKLCADTSIIHYIEVSLQRGLPSFSN